MRLLWKKHAHEEDWGFLLIDARNAFNEENHTYMLWVVRNEWPSGSRFTLKYYLHWATLVIRSGVGKVHFLFSKAGVNQGDPLAMVVYDMGPHPPPPPLSPTLQL